VTATFWHNDPNTGLITQIDGNEENFGSATIIPLPANSQQYRVEALFNAELLGNITTSGAVLFELVREGDEAGKAYTAVSAGTERTVSLQVPYEMSPPDPDAPPPLLGDEPARRKPVHYVLRAATFLDADSDGQWDSGETIDPTPANVYFTVVPDTTVEPYVSPRDSKEDQPIKIQEEL
jgi:hypothetical protein